MDWIKVKVKHAEYDFSTAPSEIFKTWVMFMIFIAAIERIPTQQQLELRLGKKQYQDFINFLKENGLNDAKTIGEKVMEDVDSIRSKRDHERKYMRKYRCNTLHKSCNRGIDKIREEKIREDKKEVTPRSYFYLTYEKKFNKPYARHEGKDFQSFEDLKATHKDHELMILIDKFFKCDDDFVKKNGYTVQIFASRINSLQADIKPARRLTA